MKDQRVKIKDKKCGKKTAPSDLPRFFRSVTALSVIVILGFAFGISSAADKAEKWEGVDKTVVERIAKEQGREASEPLINTEQGDLMLFLFLSAGAVGGFIAGYSYRALTERKPDSREKAA